MRRQRELWKLLLFFLFLATVLIWGGYVIELAVAGRLENANQWAGVSSLVLALLVTAAQLWSWWRSGRDALPGHPDPVGSFAQAVAKGSKRVEEQLGISDHLILPLRWRNAPEGSDRWENVRNAPLGDRSEPLHLDGTLDHIRTTYERIPSGRLIVLGKGGSGKTVLANRLVRALLEQRDSADPVPVLFRLNTWDAATTSLRDWMVHQLLQDHDGLDRLTPDGRTLAVSLVDDGRVLPVLDGFDEITGKHHDKAQEDRARRTALSKLPGADTPMVLTSRPDQFHEAVRRGGDVVRSAAAVELVDLDLTDAQHYLERTAKRTADHGAENTGWDEVFRRLHAQPDHPALQRLREVLATPLMVSLARTVYHSRRDPTEILDTGLFPTRRHLEDHFLGELIPAAYAQDGSRWSPRQAQRWLAFLAQHLTRLDTHDLAWWQLGATLHRHTRILTSTAAFTFAFGLVVELAVMMKLGIDERLVALLVIVLAFGCVLGPTVGLINEAATRLAFGTRAPERLRLRIRNIKRVGRPMNLERLAAEFATGLALGLAIGLSLGLAVGIIEGFAAEQLAAKLLSRLAEGLAMGFAIGLGYGLVNIIVEMLGDSHDPHEPTGPGKLHGTDRTVTLVRTLTGGLTVALTIWLTNMATGLLLSSPELSDLPLFGLLLGLPFALARLALSAWGNWLVIARIWLPLTRRLPWRPKRFLEDAYDRGVLRQAGAVYQFRHARLRDHLRGGAGERYPKVPIFSR